MLGRARLYLYIYIYIEKPNPQIFMKHPNPEAGLLHHLVIKSWAPNKSGHQSVKFQVRPWSENLKASPCRTEDVCMDEKNRAILFFKKIYRQYDLVWSWKKVATVPSDIVYYINYTLYIYTYLAMCFTNKFHVALWQERVCLCNRRCDQRNGWLSLRYACRWSSDMTQWNICHMSGVCSWLCVLVC